MKYYRKKLTLTCQPFVFTSLHPLLLLVQPGHGQGRENSVGTEIIHVFPPYSVSAWIKFAAWHCGHRSVLTQGDGGSPTLVCLGEGTKGTRAGSGLSYVATLRRSGSSLWVTLGE